MPLISGRRNSEPITCSISRCSSLRSNQMQSEELHPVRPSRWRDRPTMTLRASALVVLGGVFAAATAAYPVVADELSLSHDTGLVAASLLLTIFALVFHGLQYHHHK